MTTHEGPFRRQYVLDFIEHFRDLKRRAVGEFRATVYLRCPTGDLYEMNLFNGRFYELAPWSKYEGLQQRTHRVLKQPFSQTFNDAMKSEFLQVRLHDSDDFYDFLHVDTEFIKRWIVIISSSARGVSNDYPDEWMALVSVDAANNKDAIALALVSNYSFV